MLSRISSRLIRSSNPRRILRSGASMPAILVRSAVLLQMCFESLTQAVDLGAEVRALRIRMRRKGPDETHQLGRPRIDPSALRVDPCALRVDPSAEVRALLLYPSAEVRALLLYPSAEVRALLVDPAVDPVDLGGEVQEQRDGNGRGDADRRPRLSHVATVAPAGDMPRRRPVRRQ